MMRTERRKLIAAALASTMLLSACAKPMNPTQTDYQPSANYWTSGGTVVETKPEQFFEATVKELALPDSVIPEGMSRAGQFVSTPVFVGEHVIFNVYDVFATEEELEDEYFNGDIHHYFCIYDLDGNYTGRFSMLDDLESMGNCFYDSDSEGNIIVFSEIYDGDWNNSLYVGKYDEFGNCLVAPHPIYEDLYYSFVGARLAEEGAYWVVTQNEIMKINDQGEILLTTQLGADCLCLDLFEEDGVLYVEILTLGDSADQDTSILAQVESDGSIVMSSGKRADNLIGMRLFQTTSGLFATTKNALGRVDLQTGEFRQLIDWNQTDVDRSLLISSEIKMVTEGNVTQTISLMSSLDESMQSSWAKDGSSESQTVNSEYEQYLNPTPADDPDTGSAKTELYLATCKDDVTYESVYTTPVLIHLVETDVNPHAGQPVVWIGGVDLADGPITEYVAQYNQDLSNAAWIKLYDYSDFEKIFWNDAASEETQYQAIKYQMNSGSGPDILYGAGDQGIFENSKYLTDLNPYIDGIRGVDRSEYFDNIFEAYETQGSLYQIPLRFEVRAVMVNMNLLQGKSMSFSDMVALQNTLPSHLTLLPDYDYYSTCEWLVPATLTSWIDYSTSSISAPHDQLVDMITMITNSASGGWNYSVENYWNQSVACFESIPSSLYAYSWAGLFNTNGQWTGFPGMTSDAPSVHADLTMAIAAYSVQKEEAWDFIRFLLSQEVQEDLCDTEEYTLYDDVYTPVNRAAFATSCQNQIDWNGNATFTMIDGAVYYQKTVHPTQQTVNEYTALIESAKWRYYDDKMVVQIFADVVGECVYDGLSADEAASEIEVKVAQLLNNR